MDVPVSPIALTPHDEAARLAFLRDYRMLDDGGGHRLDDIAALASRECATPVALAGLVGTKRTFIASAVGITSAGAARLDVICRHAIAQRGILEIPDAVLDRHFNSPPLVGTQPKLRFFAAAPLVAPLGHAVGVLCVADVVPRRLSIEQHGALATLARLAVGQLELGLVALRDPLTGLHNRGKLDAILAKELATAARRRTPLGLIAVEVNHLRRINESYGERAGDAVLRAVGGVLACDSSPRNVACRLAGTRFVIVLPGMDAIAAADRAESLRKSVASLNLSVSPGIRPRITISVGVAARPEHGSTSGELLAEAGRGLSLAWAHGGNRVVIAPRDLDFSALVLRQMPGQDSRRTQTAPIPA